MKKCLYFFYQILICFFLFIVLFFSLLQSPLHPWRNGETFTDSSVFRMVVKMMSNGYMPYKDSFDHKGPVLYLINYLGYIINENWGIWLMELIFLTVSFLFMYKISRFFCNKIISIVVCLFLLISFFDYYEGGNFTEEFAILFISISLWVFIDYNINNYINNTRIILCGFCFACTLMLRPNMIGIWLVFCFDILFNLLFKKKIKVFFRYCLFFCIGTFSVIMPIIIWLLLNGTLNYFWYAYVIFNFEYTTYYAINLSNKINVFYFFLLKSSFLFSVISIIIDLYFTKKRFNVTYFFMIFVNLILVSMSGFKYLHYGMINIPLMVYPVSLMLNLVWQKKKVRIHASLLIILYFMFFLISHWKFASDDYFFTCKSGNNDTDTNVKVLSTIINEKISANDKISVYGNWDIVYLVSNHLHSTRYSYQYPIGMINRNIMTEYFLQLKEERPKIIVVQENHLDEEMINFLDSNNYELLWNEKEDISKSTCIYFAAEFK